MLSFTAIVSLAIILFNAGGAIATPGAVNGASLDVESPAADPSTAITNGTLAALFGINIGYNDRSVVAWVSGDNRCTGTVAIGPVGYPHCAYYYGLLENNTDIVPFFSDWDQRMRTAVQPQRISRVHSARLPRIIYQYQSGGLSLGQLRVIL